MSTILNGSATSSPAGEVDDVVTVLREHVLALYAGSAQPPSVVRVITRDVTVEVEWQAAAATPLPVAAQAPTEVPVEPAPVADTGIAICAPTVGTFYRAPEPGASPFVGAGDTVRVGQQVGIVEAMKLMIPIQAEHAGRIVEFLVDDGAGVEHGQRLIVLEPVS